MSDCFVLYLLLTCMKKKTSGADKFTNNSKQKRKDYSKEKRYCKGESSRYFERWNQEDGYHESKSEIA